MRLEDTTKYADKCISGELSPCSRACPFRLDVRSFLEKAEKGKWNAAYKAYRNAVVFPAVVSSLCPSVCETCCLPAKAGDEAIAVRQIEDACVRLAKNQKPDSYAIPQKPESIAVVGAGTAGLSAALCLAQKKYGVTVFDKLGGWGGSLRTHPQFERFGEDIKLQFSAADAEFIFNTEIKSLGELNGFDMIYIATGAGGADFGLLTGWDPATLSTAHPKAFLGGSLTGADTITGISQGRALSKTADYFIQTGRAVADAQDNDGAGCALDPPVTPESSKLRVKPSGPQGYNEDEAVKEAGRCLKCDCDACMISCEMLDTFKKKPKKIAMEVFTDTNVNPPFSTHTLTREAYSCNMCGHCREVCPADIDVGALLRLSREVRTGDAAYPEALHDYWLREMDFSTGQAAFYAPAASGKPCKYVLYPGCQLGAHNPEHVIRSFELLQKEHDIGIYQGCCGAPAYWAGDVKRQNDNFEEIRRVWQELDNAIFVFACATCESLFDTFLPEIPRTSLYELMAQIEDIKPGGIYENASVFDPCNARANRGMEDAVRKLAQRSGAELHELPEKNRCCGYGGHIRLANPELYDRIADNRSGMGEYPYIVYCANCREVFLSHGKDCAHVLDITLDLPRDRAIAKIDEKRENALMVKTKLLKDITGADFTPAANPWDSIELVMSDKLIEENDRKLISQSDIKETIWHAEGTGDKFVGPSGISRSCLQKPVITYWVTYKKTDGSAYEVLEAYSHRMKFSSEVV